MGCGPTSADHSVQLKVASTISLTGPSKLSKAWQAHGPGSMAFAVRCAVFREGITGWRRMFGTAACDWRVSSHGRMFNPRTGISLGTHTPSGYYVCQIQRQDFKVHRVVKLTFHGAPQNTAAWQVNHVDGDKSNNRLSNLTYATCSENVLHSYATSSRLARGRPKPVMWRKAGSKVWTQVPSAKHAAAELDISPREVSRCCSSKAQANGHELEWAPYGEKEQQGEEWRGMIDPRSGTLVAGRMVSSSGRTRLKDGSISQGVRQLQGYRTTHLQCDGSFRKEYMHRLVAAAFLGPAPSPHHIYVNHRDSDKENNGITNLEYVTAAQNVAHRYARAERKPVLRNIPVESSLCGTDVDWTWHACRREAARACGLHYKSVEVSQRQGPLCERVRLPQGRHSGDKLTARGRVASG